MYALRAVATAAGSTDPFYTEAVGRFLGPFDLDADGRGRFTWTDDPEEAWTFDDVGEALRTWKRRSRSHPTRRDGRPNRPLTAWTVEMVNLDGSPIPPLPST